MQVIYWLLIIVMVVGIIGSVVPGVPGSGLILTSIIISGILGGSFGAIKIPLIIIGEFIYRCQLWLAVKAGIGIIVGSLIGNLIQGVLAIAAVVVFVLTTWTQVYGA